MKTTHERRKRLLTRPRLQLRLVLAILVASLTALLMQLLVFAWCMVRFAETAPNGLDRRLFGYLGEPVLESFLPTAAITVAVALAVGLRATNRIAGPADRIRDHLERVARGETVGPCTIRRTDEVQELCDAVNRAVERFQGARAAAPVERRRSA